MDWSSILTAIMEMVITIAIPYVFIMIKSKVKNDLAINLIDCAQRLVIDTVTMIEQTYVIPMKNADQWDDAAAKAAFAICKQNLEQLLSNATIDAIETVHGSLDAWLKIQIESAVHNL